MRTANERKQFAVAKAISGVSELNRNLLHAFIPPQLLHKLTHQKDRELLAGPIHCMSVMFCQVEPRSVLTGACSEELFSLLNAIFTEFDYVVKSMGMFKYQHVGGSYIVACPRALSPFHPEEQDEPYPSRHAVSMAELATELQQITMSRNFQGVQLYLKVGIACGPAAGSFMGKHRRFYCLVGDVMNTASRMCSHASDKVHCTASFADVVRTANCLSIQCECRGIIRVKGKGDMETFELSRRQRGLPACQSLASTQFTMSLNRCVMSDGSVHDSVFSTSGSLLTAVSSLEVDCKSLRPEISSWLEDPKNSISSLSIEFCNEELEERFCKEQCTVHGHRMVVGLVIHLFALGLQWFHVVHPEYDYFFVDNGSPDLKASLQLIHVLLLCNIYVTTVISIVSGCAIVKDPLATKQCVSYFCLVKVMHVVVSLAGCKILPGFFGWLAIFTAELICMDGFLGTLTFKRNFVLTVGTVLVVSIFLKAFKKGLRVATLLKTIWWGIGSLTLSRTANFNQRRQWRMLCVYRTELRLLRQRLCDLLPRHIAVQNLVLPTSLESLSFQRCKVTVLQLDLCGSTAITALYPPLHIAGVLHNLFSKFDQAVQDANLFKMDILGDGYIVIGFPSTEDFTEEGNATHQSKHSFEAIGRKQTRDMSGASNSAQGARMLCLAHLMIDAVREVGKDSGLDLHCRIGISTGEVIAGTLGRLQPRFHIMGEGMRLAEQLEQTSEVDSVHVSTKFLEQLGGSALSTDDTDGGHIESVAQFVKTLEKNALLTLETCGFGDGWTVSTRLGFSIPASELSSAILQKVTQEHTRGSLDTHMAAFCSFILRPSGIPAAVRKKSNREASNFRDSVQTQVTTRKYL
jgi:class 3 adenylate cyclase